MSVRTPFCWMLACALLLGVSSLYAETPTVTGKLDQKVRGVEGKRFGTQSWNGNKQSSIRGKTFPLQHYDKHFSSLGRQRSRMDTKDSREKQMFRTPEIKEYDVRAVELSRWNQHMSDLEKRARIGTDQRMQEIMDKQRYNMMLQDTPQAYADLAEQLSMKELNRFAFRRNRSAEVPLAEQAGGGADVSK